MEEEARRRRELEEQTRLRSLRALSHMLPVLAFIYAAATAMFLIAPPFVPAEPHVLICSIASALACLVWAIMRVDDARFDTPVTLLTIAIAAGMGLAMFAVSGDMANTTTLVISIVAAGALLYRFSMYLVMVGIVFISWPAIAYGVPMRQFVLGAFYLWAAAVVGGLVLWSRRQLMVSLLQETEEAKAMRLLATEQAQTLIRARDAALASTRTKGQFLANVSHEVRTPLNGILGLLQLIDPSELPEPQSEYLREVHKSGRSLLAIVNDLLDLSKIEAGEMRLESVPFDLGSMTQEIAMNYASAAAAKGIGLVTEIDPDLPSEVCGDPLRLRQVLSNLLNNALKFTNQGEVRVCIRVVRRDEAHAVLELRVSDTGVGVSREQAESIFRPFSQADASTTREYGGTGLGLPICTQLVELMGGSLQLQSKVGQGSSFFFTVRFELEEQLSDQLKAVTEGLAGMRVLLLESNRPASETLDAQLRAWGMTVWTTASFDGAMRTLRAAPHPDVILIDVPSLGKGRLIRAEDIASAAARVGASIIAVCSRRHEIGDMIDAGIDIHVQKPVRRAKIITALLKTLDGRRNESLLSDDPERPSLPAPIATKSMRSNGIRILVAEDNAINCKVAQAHLQALGYEVDTVTDGEAVLEALQQPHPYAAVLMDGQMPNMDGYQAARALREHEAESGQRRVPIIALTAHAMTGDRRTAFAAGMDDYLSKPFTQKQLQLALARWTGVSNERISQFPSNALDTSITAQLLELERDEPGFLCDVIDSFFRTAEDSIARMKTATLGGDLQALRAAAHMVCGSSQQLGVRRFGVTCRKLEQLDTIEDAEALLAELESDLEGARDALTGLADRALDAAS
ncbi:MAG: ATP-binding protein [Myxococcales bacterium]|nr:ATP-binding protein [Myxococcales bacterium]MDH3484964.1 ATP-binding protein [Myxococcales bacterium]